MATVSHVVKRIVDEAPFLNEALSRDIINYANLAEELKPRIEKEMGGEVTNASVVMALRRYSELLTVRYRREKRELKSDISSRIVLKTRIMDIALLKSPHLFKKLECLYSLVDFERGDTLHIIHGNKEVSVITEEKYEVRIMQILKEERTIHIEHELVSLSLSFSEEWFYTSGILLNLIRTLAWQNINIFEIVSTYTELTFIICKRDALRAYSALEGLVK
ncbi:MAG: hypothetical protein ABH879_02270 [archaeon]